MLRLVDANLNRSREGLRVLEDIARFILNDRELSKQLKDLRHRLAIVAAPLQPSLLSGRDSPNDVGAALKPSTDAGRPGIGALVTANARRVQESLRVLEETTRLPGFEGVDWQVFQDIRFAVYEVEKQLAARISRKIRSERVKGLHLVMDTEWLKGRTEAEVARAAIRGGASMVQLRDKRRTMKDLLPIARELKEICAEAGVLFVMNDYIDLALAVSADCLHLGQSDLPLDVARKLVPLEMLLGCSTHGVEQAERAQAMGADYVAVGAIYPTQSKHSTTVVGPTMVSKIRKLVSQPIVAIGGINRENVAPVINAGADAIAVISAVMGADDIERATREIANAIEACRQTGKGGITDRQS